MGSLSTSGIPEGALNASPLGLHEGRIGGGKSRDDLAMNGRRIGPAKVPPIPRDTIRQAVAVFAVRSWAAGVSRRCATAASDGAEVLQRLEFPFEGAVPTSHRGVLI